jgi:hypothetical protein
MAQSTQEADTAPDLKPSPANALEQEQDHVRALRQRFNAAARARIRISDQLHARTSQCRAFDDDRKHGDTDPACSDPDGGRP